MTRRYREAASQAVALAGPGDAAIARLAEHQHGVFSSEQAELCGLSRKACAGRRSRSQWNELYRGVYLLGVGAPSYPARVLAAVLARAPAVAAGGFSAGWLNGMLGRQPAVVEITILDGRNRAPLDGVRLSRPRAYAPQRIFWRQGIPVLAPMDTVLELAAVMGPEDLEAVCAILLRKRLVSRSELEYRIGQAAGRPGIAALRAAAADPKLTRSGNERRLLTLIRQAELPEPETNVVVEGKELDLYWPDARLAVEVDAYSTHGTVAAFEDDHLLDADFEAAGIKVLRFTRRRIRASPYAVIARIAAVLALRRGGLPPVRRRR